MNDFPGNFWDYDQAQHNLDFDAQRTPKGSAVSISRGSRAYHLDMYRRWCLVYCERTSTTATRAHARSKARAHLLAWQEDRK